MKTLMLAAAFAAVLVSGCAALTDRTSPAAGSTSAQDSDSPGNRNSPYPYNSPWGY